MIDEQAIIETRAHFADLCLRCIEDAQTGETRVNDLDRYVEQQTRSRIATLAGENDHTFTHRQYAHYLQTGVCVALLP